MNEFQIEESVKIKNSLPELDLPQGSIGVVRSIWHTGNAYEIEFVSHHVRGLLMENQLEKSYG